MTRTRRLTALCAAVLLLSAGCIERTISVHSDPPDAEVLLDGLEIGQTPVSGHRFYFYGTREITVDRPGYLCEKLIVEIDAPWHSRFPIDIFTELIWPWTIRDDRHYYVALRRTEPIEPAVLLRHADETREIARTRLDAARRRLEYKPRAYVVKGAEKPFILWAPWTGAPRRDPDVLPTHERPASESTP